ncbi:hypothetical protein ACW95P_01990 [Candidatus Mycoplasma pogonae]
MKKWTSRRIAFLAILTATAVVFVIIGVRVAPFAIIPVFRFSIIGLPIKITSLIFGPILGAFTAIISDVLSLLFVPGIFSYHYSISLIITGIVPGIVVWFYRKIVNRYYSDENLDVKYQKRIAKLQANLDIDPVNREQKIAKYQIKLTANQNKQEKDKDKKLKLIYLVSGIFFLVLTVSLISGTILNIKNVDEVFANSKWIKDKYAFIGLLSAGSITMILGIILGFFKMKTKNFLNVIPIIVFSAILEPITTVIAAMGDLQIKLYDDLQSAIISHIIFSPVKIWINTIVIYISYMIVSPLIFRKESNGY